MTSARLLSKLAAAAARRAGLTLTIAALPGIGGAVLAFGLQPTAATSSFVSSSSATYRGTQDYYGHFGEEPVAVVVQGDLQQLVLGPDLGRLIGLEGCLSGRLPAKALPAEGGANGPCARLGRLGSVKVVFGPGTFLNEAGLRIQQEPPGLNRRAPAPGPEPERSGRNRALAPGT